MFDADRPILKSSQDKLGRATFAKYLARCMLDHHYPESLTIGLYGGWGVGKTSIINMIFEELTSAATNLEDREKPIILNFSPWSYSGQNQLIYNFFRRLVATLKSDPYLENKEQIVSLLELYVSYFTQKPNSNTSPQKRNFFSRLLSKNKKNDKDKLAWESGRDLTLVKQELNDLLSLQKHKIIIMIDNISRLYDYEIKQIFQIVKSMGDYVNTVYLLAMDKKSVVTAINKLDGSGGEEYVEKIIQLPFDIPPITHYDLEAILADRLSQLVGEIPEESWQPAVWADIYYGSLKYFFKNCRDITRYINTLSFGYPRLKDIVNPVDYFAITALEVFTPNVSLGIKANKDLFTDLLDNVYFLNPAQLERDKLRCDEILTRNQRIEPNILLALVMHLFPRIRHLYEPQTKFYHSDIIARKLKRICSPDVFDAYFRLSMQTTDIPQTEFNTLLELANHTMEFDQAITRLNQDERVIKFLDKLDNTEVIAKIDDIKASAIISALLDDGDLMPQGKTTYFSLSTPMRIHRIIHALLRRIPSNTKRYDIVSHAIKHASKSLYIIIHELNETAQEHENQSDHLKPLEFRDFHPSDLEKLRQLAIDKIKNWASLGMLDEQPHLYTILKAWYEWGDTEECHAYVKKITDTDRGLLAFLIAVFNLAIIEAMEDYHKNPTWEKYLIDMKMFIDPNELIPHARLLFEDDYFEKLREKEQLALLIFLDLMKIKTKKIIPQTTI